MVESLDFDCLLVCNSNLELESLSKLQFDTILFVSTHYLYKYEKEKVINYFNKVEFLCFADFFDDNILFGIDEKVRLACLESENYIFNYQEGINYRKCKHVYSSLSKKYTWEQCFFNLGLGISSAFWSKFGTSLDKKSNKKLLKSISSKFNIKRFRSKKLRAHIFMCDGKAFVFLHEPKRIQFKKEYERNIQVIEYKKLDELLTRIKEMSIEDFCLCSTIHLYSIDYSLIGHELYVFLDGFHPSNYPFSYMGQYKKAIFVYKDFIGKKWLDKIELKSLESPDFIAKEYLSEKINTKEVKYICLLMNHTGDWSALINRSDTDILIDAFVNIACKFQNFKFIIRLHPTSTHQNHEGKNAFIRVQNLIKFMKLKNLSISDQKLEDDLDSYDLFISEYSNTLLDVYKLGKLGIICNLTNRRSFMIDYEECGFPTSDSLEGLQKSIQYVIENTEEAIERQSEAAKNYNNLFTI